MKIKIRQGVFETNSSSVHSLTMCLENDYEKWCKGEVLLYNGYGYLSCPDENLKKGNFYTLEEAIKFEQNNKYNCNVDWNNMEEVMDLLHDNSWYDYKYYCKYSSDFEDFKSSYTTPNGEKIIAFGYYGHD